MVKLHSIYSLAVSAGGVQMPHCTPSGYATESIPIKSHKSRLFIKTVTHLSNCKWGDVNSIWSWTIAVRNLFLVGLSLSQNDRTNNTLQKNALVFVWVHFPSQCSSTKTGLVIRKLSGVPRVASVPSPNPSCLMGYETKQQGIKIKKKLLKSFIFDYIFKNVSESVDHNLKSHPIIN